MRSRPGKVRLKSSPAELLEDGLLLDPSSTSRRLDLTTAFGNSRPVEVEVGPGKGMFLLRRAARRPEINLLGVEWIRRYAWYAADRARRAGLRNVRLMCADAETVFRVCLPEQSVWRVHIYFPDPWPKRKHRRRRLIRPPFIGYLHRALRIGGSVGIVTDHPGYFRQIRWVLCAQAGLAAVPSGTHPDLGRAGPATNFWRKYVAQGKQFYGIAAIRYL